MMDGIWDSVQMIDAIIVKLNTIPVTGVENCIKMVDVIQRLGALRKGIQGERAEEAIANDANHN